MSVLSGEVTQRVREKLRELTAPVNLIVFTHDSSSPTGEETRTLMKELATISDRIRVELYDVGIDMAKRDEYRITKVPATVVEGIKDYGIRFYGLPSGYEFAALLEALRLVSQGDSMLASSTREHLKGLGKPVHIQVFVTPPCPYCVEVVQTAQQMALESDFVTSDVVEAAEFPDLSQKYQIFVVPTVIINETAAFVGAVPEAEFLEHVMKAGV
ncbi:MAG: thioredoxin family protein [Methanomicrobia archaeon]|nr:thioredoxin family protein [Methanomicrobia archaeon]